jgi:hypothetical protein
VQRLAILGIFLAAGVDIAQLYCLNKGLQNCFQQPAKCLLLATTHILEHAHKTKDDLLLQEMVHGLAQSPGVALAVVSDPQGIILAHGDPTRLGQSFYPRKHPSNQYVLARNLNMGGSNWGKIYLNLSSQTINQWFKVGLFVSGVGSVTLALWGLWFWRAWSSQFGDEVVRRKKLEALCQSQTQELHALRASFQKEVEAWQLFLVRAVDQIAESVLFLDHHQRVAGISASAAKCLSAFGLEANPVGKSWLEIPVLAQAGKAIQKSLESANQEVISDDSADAIPLRFMTNRSANGELLGTWVFIGGTP